MKKKLEAIVQEITGTQGVILLNNAERPWKPPVLVAKNGRARKYISSSVSLRNLRAQYMRAEDIPSLVDNEMKDSFGLTTTEYLEEYKLQNPQNTLVSQEISWNEEGLRYSRPAMCVLSCAPGILRRRADEEITVVVKDATSALSTKLALEWLAKGSKTVCKECGTGKTERTAIPAEKVVVRKLNGELEALARDRIRYFCVEIVGRGDKARKYGLSILEPPLFWVNLALVANKNYLSQLRGS